MASESSGSGLRVLCISPAHPPNDPRVLKTIRTLRQQHEVCSLLPWQTEASIGILPFHSHLISRLVAVHPLVLWHLLRFRPQVVHLFMPELLPLGLLHRLLGGRVVYEVQENLRCKFNRKPRNKALLFRWLFDRFDRLARRWCYCVFTEDSYLETYQKLSLPFAVVHNFPEPSGFKAITPPEQAIVSPTSAISSASPASIELCYLGLISVDRGLDTMLAVIARLQQEYPSIRLHLFGRCCLTPSELEALPHYLAVREQLSFHGHVDHAIAFPIMVRCLAGFALLKPIGDYPASYPAKLFEYMTLGIPVITSNFPLYRSIVETHNCGFCVEPANADVVAERVHWLFSHSDEVDRIRMNGKQAVASFFTWQTEANKLLELYQKIDF